MNKNATDEFSKIAKEIKRHLKEVKIMLNFRYSKICDFLAQIEQNLPEMINIPKSEMTSEIATSISELMKIAILSPSFKSQSTEMKVDVFTRLCAVESKIR